MPDHDAFLRTIRERPEDDGPRLVYADWLEEQGDARGEFIRIQCELAKLPPWDPRRPALEEREADLLAVHDYEWLGRPPKWVTGWEFKRGFVDRFVITRPTLGGLKGLLKQTIQPALVVDVGEGSGFALAERTFLESPHLDTIGGLFWNGWFTPSIYGGESDDLITSPRLAGLRSFGIRGQAAGDDVLDFFDQRPRSRDLEVLQLNHLSTARHVDRFLNCRTFNNVESVSFLGSLHPSFVADLGQAPFRWRNLDLGSTCFSGAELAGLADCRRLEELRLNSSHDLTAALPAYFKRLHLNLDVPVPLPEWLPRLPVLPSLEWLHVRSDAETPPPPGHDAAIIAEVVQRLRGPVFHLEAVGHGLMLGDLARMPAKDRFRKLFIDCEDVTDEELRALAECDGFTSLQSFHLSCRRLTSRQVEILAEVPFPPSLRRLSINSTLVDDCALAGLIKSPYLQRLTLMDLHDCRVGKKTVEAIAESPGLPWLRDLVLPVRAAMDEAYRPFLQAAPGLSPLCRLRGR